MKITRIKEQRKKKRNLVAENIHRISLCLNVSLSLFLSIEWFQPRRIHLLTFFLFLWYDTQQHLQWLFFYSWVDWSNIVVIGCMFKRWKKNESYIVSFILFDFCFSYINISFMFVFLCHNIFAGVWVCVLNWSLCVCLCESSHE